MCAQLTPTKRERKLDEPSSPVFSYKKIKKREKSEHEDLGDDNRFVNNKADVVLPPNRFVKKLYCSEHESNTKQKSGHNILYSNLVSNSSKACDTNIKNLFSYARDLENVNVADKNIKRKVCSQSNSPGFQTFSALANIQIQTQCEDKNMNISQDYLTDSELLTTTDLLQDFATKAINFSQWNYHTQMLKSSKTINDSFKNQINVGTHYRKNKSVCESREEKCNKILDEGTERFSAQFFIKEHKNIVKHPLDSNGTNSEDKFAIGSKRKLTPILETSAEHNPPKANNFSQNEEKSPGIKLYDNRLTKHDHISVFNKQKTSPMFSTASGKSLMISEINLNKAKEVFSGCDDDLSHLNEEVKSLEFEKLLERKSCSSEIIDKKRSFTKDSLSTSKMKHAFDIGKRSDNALIQNSSFVGFQTAKGKKISVPEKALTKSYELFFEDSMDNVEHIEKDLCNSPHSHNTVKKRRISERLDIKEFDESNILDFQGFENIRCISTNESEEVLSKASNNIIEHVFENKKGSTKRDKQNKYNQFKASNKGFQGFQTASGTNAIVSEEALLKARTLLEDDITDSKGIDRIEEEYDNKGLYLQNDAENKVTEQFRALNEGFEGFQTASVKNTSVSEKPLLKDRALLEDNNCADSIYKAETEIEAAYLKETGENAKADKRKKNVLFFQTASGKTANVSEEALLKARTVLYENKTADSEHIDNLSKEFESRPNGIKEKHKVSNKNILGFQTASGKNATVSAEALSKARILLEDNIIADSIDKISKNCRQNNVSGKFKESNKTFQGFQTASGKNTNVSEEALSKARAMLINDTTDSICKEDVNAYSNDNEVCEKYSVIKRSIQKYSELSQKNEISMYNEASKNNNNNQDLIPLPEPEVNNVVWKFNKNNSTKTPTSTIQTQNDQDEIIEIKEPGSPILMKNQFLINKRRCKMKNENKPQFKSGIKYKTSLRPLTLTQEIADSTTALIADELSFKNMFEGSLVTSPSHFLTDITDIPKPIIIDNNMSVKEISNVYHNLNKTLSKTDIYIKDVDITEPTIIPQQISNEIPKTTFKIPYKQGASKIIDSLKRTANDMNLEYSTPFAKKLKQTDQIEDKIVDEDQLLINNTQIISKLDERQISDEIKIMRDMEFDKQKSRIKLSKRRKLDCKPLKGSCLTNRTISSNRISWSNCTKGLTPQNFDRDICFYRFHMKKSIINLCIVNVEEFFFSAWDYYSIYTCKTNTSGILCGDGAVVIIDDESNITIDRIVTAFLTSPGVDSSIINDAWVRNHFKWIILKLAAMERSFPVLYSNRACTPNNLMLQLKYRYDREIDLAERSCIKKILQADDTAEKPMVLYCADIYPLDSENNTSINDKKALYELEISDGWYSVRTKIDALMSKAISNGKLKIGNKIYMIGSRLLNCAQGCDPLEVPPEVRLQIFSNSSTRVRWDARLGYTSVAPMFPCLGTVHPLGGLVYLTDFIIVRRYPTVYLVKHNGKTTLHSERLEMKLGQQYEKQRSEEVEKVYSQVLKMIQRENIKDNIKKETLNEKDVTKVRNPELLFDLMTTSHDPLYIQSLLTDSQKALISEHYDRKQSDITNEIENRVHEMMSKTSFSNRTSSQLLKVRVMPICRDNKPEHKHSAILSIWRPNSSTSDILQEKSMIRANNCTAESIRNGDLQLSAGRQASFKNISNNNHAQQMYPFRTYTRITDIYQKGFSPNFNEIDTIGVVIHISPWHNAHSFQTVYLADLQQKVISVSFWGGIQHHGYEQVIKLKSIIACSNLQWRDKNGKKWIPNTYVTDMTIFSSNPRQDHLKCFFDTFKATIMDNIDDFVHECEENLSKSKTSMSLSKMNMTNKQSPLNVSGMSDMTSPVTPVQKKINILSMIPEPPKLSPISFSTPKKKLSKPFKPPSKILTNIDSNVSINNEITRSTGSPPLSLE